jgi:hypothetical protein
MPTWSAKRPSDARHQALERGMAQLRLVRGQEREALVDDTPLAAERPDLAIPAASREAAVLHEGRRRRRPRAQLLELVQADVADAEEPCLAGGVQLFHGLPDLEVGGA